MILGGGGASASLLLFLLLAARYLPFAHTTSPKKTQPSLIDLTSASFTFFKNKTQPHKNSPLRLPLQRPAPGAVARARAVLVLQEGAHHEVHRRALAARQLPAVAHDGGLGLA